MQLHNTHPWDLPPDEAIALQNMLAEKVIVQPFEGEIDRIAGVDVSYKKGRARAAIVVLDYGSMEVVSQATAEMEADYPYISGLLSFRELPAVLAAAEKLDLTPDAWMCDAQGIAHPRKLGTASHLGILLDAPTIGCAKSILRGDHPPVPERRGSVVPLTYQGEVVGNVVRTRDNVRPVIVSVGHRMDLESATRIVLECGRGLRLPEPTRLADKLAGQWDG